MAHCASLPETITTTQVALAARLAAVASEDSAVAAAPLAEAAQEESFKQQIPLLKRGILLFR